MKIELSTALRIAQLMSCGAVVGLYIAKATDVFGVDVTPAVEHAGVGVGAIAVGVLKVFHLV